MSAGSQENLGGVLLKAIVTAIATALVAQLFLHFTHSNVDPYVVTPAAGGAGFSIHGWKFIAPLLAAAIALMAAVFVLLIVLGVFGMILGLLCG